MIFARNVSSTSTPYTLLRHHLPTLPTLPPFPRSHIPHVPTLPLSHISHVSHVPTLPRFPSSHAPTLLRSHVSHAPTFPTLSRSTLLPHFTCWLTRSAPPVILGSLHRLLGAAPHTACSPKLSLISRDCSYDPRLLIPGGGAWNRFSRFPSFRPLPLFDSLLLFPESSLPLMFRSASVLSLLPRFTPRISNVHMLPSRAHLSGQDRLGAQNLPSLYLIDCLSLTLCTKFNVNR